MSGFLHNIRGLVTGCLITALVGLPAFAAVNVKTLAGVAIGNVKTIGGVAKASVKTVGGVDNTSSGDITSGLVSRWELDEGSGSTAVDDIGGINGSLVNGPSWSAGYLNFDGTDDYIGPIGSTTPFAFIHETHVFSVTAWVWHDSTGSGQLTIIGNTAASGEKGFYLDRLTGGELRIAVFNGDGVAAGKYLDTDGAISSDVWTFIAVTIDGAGDVVIYVDGASVKTGSITSTTTGLASRELQIGAAAEAAPARFWKGRQDDVRIYDRALTSGEISTLNTNGRQ